MAVKASATVTLSSIRDLQSCTRYYLLQSSTLSPPAKPTAKPPGGSWTTTEPSYTSGSTNSLYFCDLNVFTDGDFAYSDVSLSSSYEAAKAAYNKAQAAEGAAAQALSSTECIVGTQTASTNAWTGRASFASLTDGQVILYWLPYAGTSTAATLNLTLSGGGTTGAKNVYISSTTRCTTHIAAGNMVQMVYRASVSIGGTAYTGWWISRTQNSDTYDRIRFNNSIKANTAISASRLILDHLKELVSVLQRSSADAFVGVDVNQFPLGVFDDKLLIILFLQLKRGGLSGIVGGDPDIHGNALIDFVVVVVSHNGLGEVFVVTFIDMDTVLFHSFLDLRLGDGFFIHSGHHLRFRKLRTFPGISHNPAAPHSDHQAMQPIRKG